jgi:hypothetical protein
MNTNTLKVSTAATFIIFLSGCSGFGGSNESETSPVKVSTSTTLSPSSPFCLRGDYGSCSLTLTVKTDVSASNVAVFVSTDGATPQFVSCWAAPGTFTKSTYSLQAGHSYEYSAWVSDSCSVTATTGLTQVASVKVNSQKLVTAGHGLIDPSLASGGTSSRVWLTYSAMYAAFQWAGNNAIDTRLAYSDDQGATWTDTGTPINTSLDVTVPLPPPNNAGTWDNETSQLVYDPEAPAGQRYKLLWMKYLQINGIANFTHSWIALKMADSPINLPSAPEIKLFAGTKYDSLDNNKNAPPAYSPVGGAPKIMLNTIDPALSGCEVFGEPGMYADSSGLYVSMLCNPPTTANNFLFMVKCAAPCNPESASAWKFIAKLDVPIIDYIDDPTGNGMFSSPGLFGGIDGNVYLAVTNLQYLGCDIYRFTNLDQGLFTGPITTVNGPPSLQSATCTYHKAASKAGVMYTTKDITGSPVAPVLGATGVNF